MVWGPSEQRGAAAKNLRFGEELRMHLESDNAFVFHIFLQWRFSFVPVGRLLIGVSDAQDGGLFKVFADDLQTDG